MDSHTHARSTHARRLEMVPKMIRGPISLVSRSLRVRIAAGVGISSSTARHPG